MTINHQTEDMIRIIAPHCKIASGAIKLLRKEGIEPAINYLRKFGTKPDLLIMLKEYFK